MSAALDAIRSRAEAYASHGTPGLHAPQDRAALLAAVDNVEALATAWEGRAKHLMSYSEECPESVRLELYEQGEEMADNARKIRAEITAALEGKQ